LRSISAGSLRDHSLPTRSTRPPQH
jgi:hypothetical protein